MPGSTRRGCTQKVSGRGERRAEIRLGGASPTGPPGRPGSAARLALRPCTVTHYRQLALVVIVQAQC